MTENTQELVPASGPGMMLAQARGELGLTLDQVAEQMKVSVSYLQALEQDSYESLPGATFVRGYLRNYARLLQLDEEAVVELCTCQIDHGNRRHDNGRPDAVQGLAPRQTLMIGSMVLLVILLVVGGYLWSSNDSSPDAEPTSAPQELQDQDLPELAVESEQPQEAPEPQEAREPQVSALTRE